MGADSASWQGRWCKPFSRSSPLLLCSWVGLEDLFSYYCTTENNAFMAASKESNLTLRVLWRVCPAKNNICRPLMVVCHSNMAHKVVDGNLQLQSIDRNVLHNAHVHKASHLRCWLPKCDDDNIFGEIQSILKWVAPRSMRSYVGSDIGSYIGCQMGCRMECRKGFWETINLSMTGEDLCVAHKKMSNDFQSNTFKFWCQLNASNSSKECVNMSWNGGQFVC